MNKYLDTHPLDENALNTFKDALTQRKQLLQTYADNFEPLTINCICPDSNNKTKNQTKYPDQRHFTWCGGPLPWEGSAFYVDL